MSAPLWAVTCLFNSQRYERRAANFRRFRGALTVPLVAVELSFDGRFELTEADADILIRLSGGDVMWQKERLLNIGVTRLPPECTAVALLDADALFQRKDWAAAALSAIERVPAIQPFHSVRYLPRNWSGDISSATDAVRYQQSVASAVSEGADPGACLGRQSGDGRGSRTAGMAWVLRRDLLARHGLFDASIIGGGDTAVGAASWGVFEAAEERHAMNDAQKRHYRAWAEPWYRDVNGQVGFVDGDAFHLWHGEMANRRATTRHLEIAPHGFDPAADITAEDGQPWRWSSDKPKLHWQLRNYFAAREEDGPQTNQGVLIVRHPYHKTHFYDCVLDWAREHVPECVPLLSVRELPITIDADFNVKALVFWLQDPIEYWSYDAYLLAESLAVHYAAKGVAVINQPSVTSALSKAVAAPLIASAGFEVPRMLRITDPAAFRKDRGGLRLPLFVRENRIHQSAMLLVRSDEELKALPIETFKDPLAVEITNTADPRDGLFRKYRYFACGEFGVSQHLQVAQHWIVRGEQRVTTPQTIAEELAYISRPDPNHERFQTAMKALGLDMAAFDYSHDRAGKVVVWEVNSFPHIQFAVTTTVHRNRAIHRSIAAMIANYLRRADLPVPAALREWVDY